MQWEKVVTDPLGIAGFALALVFALTTRVISQRRKQQHRWLAPAAYILAVICVIGGFSLAWRHDVAVKPASSSLPSATPSQPASPPPAVSTGDIQQNGDGNVAGVQGNVNVNVNAQPKKAKAKKTGPQ